MWQTLIASVLPVLVTTIIAPLLAYLGLQLANLIKAKVANQKLAGFLENLSKFAMTAVQATMQTSVDAAAKAANGGKLPAEAAKAAKDAALESLKARVSLEEIMKAFACDEAEAEKIAETQIEAAVLVAKSAASVRIQPLSATNPAGRVGVSAAPVSEPVSELK